jgi:hypothetical protein
MSRLAALRVKRQPVAISVVPFSHLSLADQKAFEIYEAADSPDVMFDKKVEHLAELLNCTEAEATKIILSRI